MKKVVTYQLFLLIALGIAWSQEPLGRTPSWLSSYELTINCILMAMLAGVLYCLRAVYLNASVQGNWKPQWETWYYLRPIASAIAGLVGYVFLRAGVIVLEAEQAENAGNFGYLAFSFIAGYNVDRFLKKIEDLAKSSFGVENSRSYEKNENDD